MPYLLIPGTKTEEPTSIAPVLADGKVVFSVLSVAAENLKSCQVSTNNCHGRDKKGHHSTQDYIQALQPSILSPTGTTPVLKDQKCHHPPLAVDLSLNLTS